MAWLLHEERLLRAANFVRGLPPDGAQMQWTNGRPQSTGFCITDIFGLRLASRTALPDICATYGERSKDADQQGSGKPEAGQ